MTIATPILARGDDPTAKLVGAIVVLVIWGIAALARSMGAAAKQPPRRTPPVPRPGAGVAPPLPPRSHSAAIPTALPPLPQLAARPGRAAPGRRPPARPPVLPAAQAAAPSLPRKPLPARDNAATASTTPQAASIATLLNPTTVRAQFILAEVLQPPISLRTRRSF